jgi:1-acyl-sn-glycerol-3-phosphate acyltransferase
MRSRKAKGGPIAAVSGRAVEPPPPTSGWIQKGFHTFLGPYLRRHFHCIGIHQSSYDPTSETPSERSLGSTADPADDRSLRGPVIIYTNHPAWWDPLIAHVLNAELFKPRQFYAPIDAEALKQYRVFEKLGFYGINLGSTSGAAAFLRTSMSILRDESSALWITPEGRFCDVRDHSAPLMPGLAHLCQKLGEDSTAHGIRGGGRVIPMAMEYVFWEERLPACLVMFGQPLRPSECGDWDKPRWNNELSDRLRQTQRRLAEAAIGRDSSAFKPLIRGNVGAGGFYDTMRRFKSWMTRTTFRPGHGDHFK